MVRNGLIGTSATPSTRRSGRPSEGLRSVSSRSIPLTRLFLLAALLLAGAVGVVSVGGPPSSRAAASPTVQRAPQFGLVTGSKLPPGASFNDQVAAYSATGAGWVRTGFSWSGIERSPGGYDWSVSDAVASGFGATGMKVLGVLAYTPAWAADPACAAAYGSKCAPVDPAEFARFAAAAAERYDGDGVNDAPGSPVVSAWEIWNEPNLASFWRPAPDPVAYTALLRQADSAIHAAAPAATVVSAGLSPAGGMFAPLKFLSAMYAAGAAGSFDALGFHPYSYPALPTKLASWNAWQQMFTAFPNFGQPDSLRSLMVTNGDAGKKIWATEYGAPTGGDTNGDGVSVCDDDGVHLVTEDNCVTEDRQRDLVTDAYAQWLSYDWAGPLFWYSFQDLGTGSPSIEGNFGLRHTDGSAKPALAAYVDAARQSMPTTTKTKSTSTSGHHSTTKVRLRK